MRHIKLIVVLVFVLLAGASRAQERVTLTTPVAASVTNWSIDVLHLEPINGRIVVRLISNVTTIEHIEKIYDARTTPTGASLLSSLNTANLTTRSLEARVYDRLIADNVFAGTVTGTPR